MDDVDGAVGGFVVPATVLVQQLPDEGLMFMDLQTEEYFGLDQVGTAMYQALLDQGTVEGACDELLQQYDVARERLAADVEAFVTSLLERGLIVRTV